MPSFTLARINTLILITSAYRQKQQYLSSEFINNAEIQINEYGRSPTFKKFEEGNQQTVFTFFIEHKKSFPQFSNSDNAIKLLNIIDEKSGENHYRYDQ